MTTLRSFAETIAIQLGQEEDQFQIELLRQRILSFRQLILKREYEKRREFPPQVIMAFDVKLQQMEKFGTKMYVSDELPSALITTLETPFLTVGNCLMDGNRKSYNYCPPARIEYIQYNRFSNLGDYYTYENKRLMSSTKELLRVRYVPEDPIHALEFTKDHDMKYNCGKSLEASCFYEDDLILEETMAASILAFFGQNTSRRNVQRNQNTTNNPQENAEI